MELLSKITPKTIGVVPKPKSLTEGQAMSVAIVYGIASGYKADTSNYGEFVKFKGEFKAKNLATDETFKSSNLIMPRTFEGLLQQAVDRITADNPNGVEFNIILGVRYSEKGNTGYEWTISPVRQPKENDMLATLEQEAEQALKALPNPDAKPEGKKKH